MCGEGASSEMTKFSKLIITLSNTANGNSTKFMKKYDEVLKDIMDNDYQQTRNEQKLRTQLGGDIMNFSEGMAKLEEKVQARARLRVKKYRLDNKQSQQEVADYLGIDISTYNKYEKGSRKLNNGVVRKIAEYYNIKVSDILD